jgi:hypothetical protein
MPLRSRPGYAADLPRGLLAGDIIRAEEFSARRRIRTATQPPSVRFELVGLLRGVRPLVPHVHRPVLLAGPRPSNGAGLSRRCRGGLPPLPASPGSGCLLLHRPAATGRRSRSFTYSRVQSAAWRSMSQDHTWFGPVARSSGFLRGGCVAWARRSRTSPAARNSR